MSGEFYRFRARILHRVGLHDCGVSLCGCVTEESTPPDIAAVLDAPETREAVARAMETTHPDWLNVGYRAGSLALADAAIAAIRARVVGGGL